MAEKICPFVKIWQAVAGEITIIKTNVTKKDECIKERCEFWTKRKNHYKQQNEYGCALVLSVQQKTF